MKRENLMRRIVRADSGVNNPGGNNPGVNNSGGNNSDDKAPPARRRIAR